MKNMTIRKTAKKYGVSLWQIADELGVSEPTMTRKLRHELPSDETEKILEIIDRLAEGAK